MKRLPWLLIALFCAVLVQVQPIDGPLAKPVKCARCHSGACGMPGCCPTPASAPTVFSSEQSARVDRVPAPHRAQPVRGAEENFYALFIEPVAGRGALPACAEAAPAARVPLFKAHCCFLI